MEKIESFKINHTSLKRGMYISRLDGDIVTYDLRMRLPNIEPVMDNAAIHTIEHLFATFVRNSEHKDNIIYFGPMGCRTGFYFLTRGISHKAALELSVKALKFISEYGDDIPGVSAAECGNYREHDLAGAKAEAKAQYELLKGWTAEKMEYNG
ncbi:MAG: S-ribosylhomocysteine lyase [Firmicutes bacterium ADurb.Bin300]|nr:MAG: S-ribosylhomocysteine lyase [Firmicutes bacterium ADurb.Bin300]